MIDEHHGPLPGPALAAPQIDRHRLVRQPFDAAGGRLGDLAFLADGSRFEAQRGMLRCKVQQWAGLEIDPDAELCAFVGRWSIQKGIDIIADVFPAILENNPKVQLICECSIFYLKSAIGVASCLGSFADFESQVWGQ